MANNLALGIIIGAAVSSSVGRAFHSLDASASHLGRSLQQVRLGRAASEDVLRYQRQLTSLTEGQRQWGASNTRLWGQIAETERHLRTASAAAERYGINIGDIVRENRRLTQSEEYLAGQLRRNNTLQANRARRSELSGQIIGTIGLAMMAATPIKAAADFETVMLNVHESIKMNDVEFTALGESIRHMAGNMPVAVEGIGEIVAEAGKLGIANHELTSFAEDVIKMSVALDMTGEEAAQTMAHWRTAMGLSQKQAVLLGDAVNTLGDTMNISAKDLAEVVRKEGAVAMAAGFSATQAAALGAALLNSGTPTKQAAIALKNITMALDTGGQATKKQTKAFESLGISSSKVMGRMKTDAVGTLQRVLAIVAKRPASKQAELLGAMFGPKSIEPLLALIKHSESLNGALNTVSKTSNYAGANQDEYNKKIQSAAKQMQILDGAVDDLKIEMGGAFLPVFKMVVGAFRTGSTWLINFSKEYPTVIKAVAGLAMGLVSMKIAILAGSFALTTLSDVLTIGKGIFAAFKFAILGLTVSQKAVAFWSGVVTAAQWVWNASLFGCPIVWIAAAAIGLGTAAYFIIKNWDPLMKWFETKFPWLGMAVEKVKSVMGSIGDVVGSIRAQWEPLMAWFKEKFDWLGTQVDKIKGFASNIGDSFLSIGKSVGKFMTTPIIGKSAAVGAVMATTLALPAGANSKLPPLPNANRPQSVMYNTNNTFHVTQKPGEDSNALADRIATKIKQQEKFDKRGALHD